jgi:predicted acetyltransferase
MEVRRVETEREREAVRNLYPLYLHDLARWSTYYRLDEDGRWQPSHVDDFLQREEGAAYLVRADGAAAGFAWVGAGDFPRKRADRDFRLAELFVAAPFRRRGLGRALAETAIGSHRGRWQLEVIDGNEPALVFWRAFLAGRAYHEEPGDGDMVFLFET